MLDVLAQTGGLLGDAVPVQPVDHVLHGQGLRFLVLVRCDGETRALFKRRRRRFTGPVRASGLTRANRPWVRAID